jgi:hypothetical protein
MDKSREDWTFVGMCAYCVMMSVIITIPPGASRWEQGLVGLFTMFVAYVVLGFALPWNLPTLDKAAIVTAFFSVLTAVIFAF